MRTCFYFLDTAKVEKNIEYSSSNSEKEKRKLLFVFFIDKRECTQTKKQSDEIKKQSDET